MGDFEHIFASHVIFSPVCPTFLIDRVIYNDPATIVIWQDGSKTVVKCQPGDTFDERTGLLLCIAKKAMGGSRYNDVLRKWSKETEPKLRWVPVEEALPEDNTAVVVKFADRANVYDVNYYKAFNNYPGLDPNIDTWKDVTHWMYTKDLVNL